MAVEPKTTFKHLTVDSAGDIYVGTFVGLYKISGATGRVSSLTRERGLKLVSCLSKSEDGRILVGIFGKSKGLHYIDESDGLVNLFRGYAGFTETSHVVHSSDGHWLLVSFGRLWHFTDRFLRDGTLREAVVRLGDAAEEASSKPPFLTDRSGGMQPKRDDSLASLPPPPGGGGSVVRPKTVSQSFAPSETRLPPPPEHSVAAAPTSQPSEVSSLPTAFRQLFEGERILAVTETVGRLWVGTEGGGLYSLKEGQAAKLHRRFDAAVTHLLYGTRGRLFIVIGATQLMGFNGFAFDSLARVPDRVTCLLDGADRGLIMGTRQGLYSYRQGALTTVTARGDLLPDTSITTLIRFGNELWIGTRLGLARWSGDRFTVYGASDGLPSGEINSLAVHENRLWVASVDGVAVLTGDRFTSVTGFHPRWLLATPGVLWAARGATVASYRDGRWSRLSKDAPSEIALLTRDARGLIFVCGDRLLRLPVSGGGR
jgi:ligand-binding sensor domain-containing protein